MEYVYPAIFHAYTDGSYTITFPDLPGCICEGKSRANAIFMAESALRQWIEYLVDKECEIPNASSIKEIETGELEFVKLIRSEVKDSRAVRRTVSIPKWLDEKAVESGISLSRVLQDALKDKLVQ